MANGTGFTKARRVPKDAYASLAKEGGRSAVPDARSPRLHHGKGTRTVLAFHVREGHAISPIRAGLPGLRFAARRADLPRRPVAIKPFPARRQLCQATGITGGARVDTRAADAEGAHSGRALAAEPTAGAQLQRTRWKPATYPWIIPAVQTPGGFRTGENGAVGVAVAG